MQVWKYDTNYTNRKRIWAVGKPQIFNRLYLNKNKMNYRSLSQLSLHTEKKINWPKI